MTGNARSSTCTAPVLRLYCTAVSSFLKTASSCQKTAGHLPMMCITWAAVPLTCSSSHGTVPRGSSPLNLVLPTAAVLPPTTRQNNHSNPSTHTPKSLTCSTGALFHGIAVP